MNLLFVLSVDLSSNGPSVHLLKDIIKRSSERFEKVDVICLGQGSDNLGNVNYLVTKMDFKKTSFLSRYIATSKFAKLAYSLVKGRKYDVIFLQSSPASYWFVRLFSRFKCPLIYNAQDLFPHNLFFSSQMPGGKIMFFLLNSLERKSFKKINKIITISDDMKNTIKRYLCSDDSKISVIYNWSYSDKPIVRDDEPVKHLLDMKKFNVVYAGNVGKMQNVAILIHAAKSFQNTKDIHFTIIGEGARKSDLIRMASGLNNVSFFNSQPADLAENIYSSADLNVIPLANGGIFTALPSKTPTCLRSNRPCVFCIDKNSRFAEMISKEDGAYVCNPDDIEEFVRIINELFLLRNCFFSRASFIRNNMSSISNPTRYAEIFIEMCQK